MAKRRSSPPTSTKSVKSVKIIPPTPTVPRKTPTLVENFEKIRANYESIQENRVNNQIKNYNINGAGADWHIRDDWEYLKLIESARSADRNNVVIGQAVSRVINNVLQGGIGLNADTGDPEIDRYLTQKWDEFQNDPDICDVAQEDNLLSLARTALRGLIVDGDILIRPTPQGVQLIEAHRVRTPKNNSKNIVLGVELDDLRRHLGYWITQQDGWGYYSNSTDAKITRYRTRAERGEKELIQLISSCPQAR